MMLVVALVVVVVIHCVVTTSIDVIESVLHVDVVFSWNQEERALQRYCLLHAFAPTIEEICTQPLVGVECLDGEVQPCHLVGVVI